MKKSILLIFIFLVNYGISQAQTLQKLTSFSSPGYSPIYSFDNTYGIDQNRLFYLDDYHHVIVHEFKNGSNKEIYRSQSEMCSENYFPNYVHNDKSELFFLIDNNLIIENYQDSTITTINDIVPSSKEIDGVAFFNERLLNIYTPDSVILYDILLKRQVHIFVRETYNQFHAMYDSMAYFTNYNTLFNQLYSINLNTLERKNIANNRSSYFYFIPNEKIFLFQNGNWDNQSTFTVNLDGVTKELDYPYDINNFTWKSKDSIYFLSYIYDSLGQHTNYLFHYNLFSDKIEDTLYMKIDFIPQYDLFQFKNKIYLPEFNNTIVYDLKTNHIDTLDVGLQSYSIMGERYASLNNNEYAFYDLLTNKLIKIKTNFYNRYVWDGDNLIVINTINYDIGKIDGDTVKATGKLFVNKKSGIGYFNIYYTGKYIVNISNNTVMVYDSTVSGGIRAFDFEPTIKFEEANYFYNYVFKDESMYYVKELMVSENNYQYGLIKIDLTTFEIIDLFKENNLPYLSQYFTPFLFDDWIVCNNMFVSTKTNQTIINPQIKSSFSLYQNEGKDLAYYSSVLGQGTLYIINADDPTKTKLLNIPNVNYVNKSTFLYNDGSKWHIFHKGIDYIADNRLKSMVTYNENFGSNEFLYLNKTGDYFHFKLNPSTLHAEIIGEGSMGITFPDKYKTVYDLGSHFLITTDNNKWFVTISKTDYSVKKITFTTYAYIMKMDKDYIYIFNRIRNVIEQYDKNLNLYKESKSYEKYMDYGSNFLYNIDRHETDLVFNNRRYNFEVYFKQSTTLPLLFDSENLELNELFQCQYEQISGPNVSKYIYIDSVMYFNFYEGNEGAQFYKLVNKNTVNTYEMSNDHNGDAYLYPNPSSGLYNVKQEINDVNEIAIYDMSGRKLRSFHTTSSLDISDFDNGIYLYRINTSNKVLSGKIVLSK